MQSDHIEIVVAVVVPELNECPQRRYFILTSEEAGIQRDMNVRRRRIPSVQRAVLSEGDNNYLWYDKSSKVTIILYSN